VIARAVSSIPQSVKIWIKATELETEIAAKKKVLRKGSLQLVYVPSNYGLLL